MMFKAHKMEETFTDDTHPQVEERPFERQHNSIAYAECNTIVSYYIPHR